MKSFLKSYFIYIFLFFSIDLINANKVNNIILRWPSLNIVSAILNLKGLYKNDFFANKIINTPMQSIIYIFTTLLPNDHLKIVSIYSIFSLLMKTLLPITIIALASVFTVLLLNQIDKNQNVNNRKKLLGVFFIGNILFYISSTSEFFKNLIFGIKIAGWGFPTSLASARGISLLLSLLIILIILNNELFEKYLISNKKIFKISIFIINLIASIIHPIAPIICLIFLFIINTIIENKKTDLQNILYINITSCLLGLIIIYFAFPQLSIENISLYRIYIEEAHPHHYMPSKYLVQVLSNRFLLLCNFIILTSFIYFFRKKISERRIFIKLATSIFSTIFFTNSIQYLFVEKLKLALFIKLGLTFANILYNYLYFVSILLFISLLVQGCNIFSLKYTSFSYFLSEKLLDKLLIISTVSLIILSSNTYYLNISKIKNSFTYKLGNEIASFNKMDNKYTNEYIFDNEIDKILIYPREIGMINIFSDDYFPYSIDSIKLWEKRASDSENLKKCLKKNKNKCFLPSTYKNQIFYVSSKVQDKLGEEKLSKEIGGIKIYINKIDKN